MKTFLFLAGMTLMSSLAHAVLIDEPWRNISDPAIMNPAFLKNFYTLPLEARATGENKFWSGDYWALEKGNINLRWNSNRQRGFKLDSPTRDQALRMSSKDISQLAPTEKLDILMGRYDYPTVQKVYTIANKRADEWEGICHGWAPASINHNEPTPKDFVNADGIKVPFGSSDIKALVSFYYAHGFEALNTHQMGSRCFKEDSDIFRSRRDRQDNCEQDLNAGAFHIVLANRIGLEGKAFVADLDRKDEVWNHPVWFYSSQVEKDNMKPDRRSAPGTAKVIRMRTTINYTNETYNYWEPVIGTPDQIVDKKKYEYELDLSATGEILGGKWKSAERPDFLWIKDRPVQFEGLFTRLPELLND